MTQEELLALIDRAAAVGWTELDLSGQNLSKLPAALLLNHRLIIAVIHS